MMNNLSPTRSHPVNLASLDGRGGEEAPGAIGPRYLYYRLYQTGGNAIESRCPAYSDDRFLGRILSRAVTPPHTAASLKSYLCKIEGFSGSKKSSLYSSLPSKTTLKGDSCLALMSPSGPGSWEKEPMVLVIKNAEKRLPSGLGSLAGLPRANNTHFVYYRFYNKEGETTSKTSFNEDDPALGRINTLPVGSIWNVASLKVRLARVEGIGAKNLQLFKDLSSDKPMNDNADISLLTDQHPGLTADEPMAFVCLQDSAKLPAVEPSKPKIKKQVEIIPKQSFEAPSDTAARLSIQQGRKLLSDGSETLGVNREKLPAFVPPKPKIKKQVVDFIAKHSFQAPSDTPAWLSIRQGETLLSDGIATSGVNRENRSFSGYVMMNSSGKRGFVWGANVRKL